MFWELYVDDGAEAETEVPPKNEERENPFASPIEGELSNKKAATVVETV